MPSSVTTKSHILEYVALGTCFMHCCILLLNSDLPMEARVMIYFFVLFTLLVNNYYRGTRIHLWPLIVGFFLHSVSLLYGILADFSFYCYYLSCLTSLVTAYFFGTIENY